VPTGRLKAAGSVLAGRGTRPWSRRRTSSKKDGRGLRTWPGRTVRGPIPFIFRRHARPTTDGRTKSITAVGLDHVLLIPRAPSGSQAEGESRPSWGRCSTPALTRSAGPPAVAASGLLQVQFRVGNAGNGVTGKSASAGRNRVGPEGGPPLCEARACLLWVMIGKRRSNCDWAGAKSSTVPPKGVDELVAVVSARCSRVDPQGASFGGTM